MKRKLKFVFPVFFSLFIISCGTNKKEQKAPSEVQAKATTETSQVKKTEAEELSDSPRHH